MVRKRFQQILSCYLVLSLALAGAIALSPVLHRAIEHQGLGPLHTHAHSHDGIRPQGTLHVHNHDAPHRHASSHAHEHAHEHGDEAGHGHSHGFFTHSHRGFALPDFDLGELWQSIRQAFADNDNFPSPETASNHEDEHSHHSLPELLASGLVDAVTDIHPLLVAPEQRLPRPNAVPELRSLSYWDAQTPTRGPPKSRRSGHFSLSITCVANTLMA